MTEKNTIVETQIMDLELGEDGFLLSCGDRLPEVQVAYEAYGSLNESGDNAVFICQTLTSDAHCAFYHEGDDKPGWWDPLIGPGKAIDTEKFYVVCANVLGGCKGSTGPLSIDPESGKAYGTRFPLVTLKDSVKAHYGLLQQLGVTSLHAVVGGSLGGMQALEWAISYPDFVKSCACIAAGVNLTTQALAFDIIARQEIEHDPHFAGGDYYDNDNKPDYGLSRARQIGHVTYLSSASMKDKFGRDEQEIGREQQDARSKFSTEFQVESYLNYQGKKFTRRFDANSYLYITRMMDMFDLEKDHGSLENAFQKSTCRFLIVSISSDWLFPPEQQLEIVKTLFKLKKNVSYFSIDSNAGHDAFLIEYGQLSNGLQSFVAPQQLDIATADKSRLDIDLISHMVAEGQRILDVGSGDGTFLKQICDIRKGHGTCLDNKRDMVVAAMDKGLDALHLDAESAVNLISDDCFDLVILNQTIQQLHSGLQFVKEMLRIAPAGIIGFPNFAYYKHRLHLLFKGTLPKSEALPYEWYDTPNIHLVTIKDFRALCEMNHINIKALNYLSHGIMGRLLTAVGLTNWGCEQALVQISRNSNHENAVVKPG